MSEPTTPNELAESLRKMSDNAYCAYIEQMRRDHCLGSEHKLKHGKFSQDNLDAFMRAAEWLGRHKAMHEASTLLAALSRTDPAVASTADVPEGAELSYYGLCEIISASGFVTLPQAQELAHRIANAPPPQWMPIETAPNAEQRDMFVVRAFNVSNGFTGGRNYTSDAWCVWRDIHEGFARWPHQFSPTHWTPLPAAPVAKDAEDMCIDDASFALAQTMGQRSDAHPPRESGDAERQPLTDAQIQAWWASENGLEDADMCKLNDFRQVVRAVEAKHGIRSAAYQGKEA